MKKIRIIIVTVLLGIGLNAMAQLPSKNTYIGVKAGLNVQGIEYKGDGISSNTETAILNIPNNIMGGIFVERSLPRYSYGMELNYAGMASKNSIERGTQTTNLTHRAEFLTVRTPLRFKLIADKAITPYVFVAPCLGTYESVLDSCHTQMGNTDVTWGTLNMIDFHVSCIAGAGIDGKLTMGGYHVLLRLEGAYNYGIRDIWVSNEAIRGYLRGWEASISIAFPLQRNDDVCMQWTSNYHKKARR